MAGSGSLVLAAANTYSGPTTVSAGTVQLNSAWPLNSTVTVNVNNGLAFGLAYRPGTGRPGRGGNVTLATTSSSAVTLTAGGNNANTTYSGTLSGSGGLTKVAEQGVLILAGSNTYTAAPWSAAARFRLRLLRPGQRRALHRAAGSLRSRCPELLFPSLSGSAGGVLTDLSTAAAGHDADGVQARQAPRTSAGRSAMAAAARSR